MPTWAAPEDVESAAQNWSYEQVNCRIYGHNWRPLTATHRPGFYTLYQRCGRCASSRTQELDDYGFPLSGWHIVYSEGYLLKNLGRVGQDGRAVLRLTSLRGITVTEVQDEPER